MTEEDFKRKIHTTVDLSDMSTETLGVEDITHRGGSVLETSACVHVVIDSLTKHAEYTKYRINSVTYV